MTSARSITAISVIVILALALSGFVTGAIGSKIMGQESLVPQTVPHIPPQKIFVNLETSTEVHSTDSHAKDTHADHSKDDHAKDDHSKDDHGDHHGDHHAESGMIGAGDGLVLTNTILSSWIVTILLIATFYFATRRMKLVPSGLQNFVEFVIESLYNFVNGVAGAENARKFFPVMATIFLFVLCNAWAGLLPIYPTFGILNEEGELIRHVLRPAGTDLNMPIALAIVSFIFVEYWGLRILGIGYLSKFFPTENIRKGNFSQVPIDIFVGVLELLSEFIRIVSFTFRLFGNMTAGEILLIMITYLIPFVAVLPFYGLELLVGLIQALIFGGLTLVFVVVAVTPHEGEEH